MGGVRRVLRLWRLALRLSWRSARASMGKSVLLSLLTAVPAILGVAYASIQVTSSPSPDVFAASLMGQAQSQAVVGSADAAPHSAQGVRGAERRALGVLPRGSRLFLDVTASARFTVSGGSSDSRSRVVPGVLRLVALADPGTRGLYRLVLGSVPRSSGEVVLSERLAARLGVQVGQMVRAQPVSRLMKVTGIVVSGQNTDALIAVSVPDDAALDALLAAGDQADSTASAGWLVFADRLALPRLSDAGFSLLTRQDARRLAANGARQKANVPGTLAVLALTLAESGLLVGAAFTMAARRRRQELGLLAVAGADPRMRRRILAGSGALVGGVAALVTVPLAALLAALLKAPLAEASRQEWESLRLDPLVTASAPAMAFASALVAAWISGRSIASLSPVAIVKAGSPVRPAARRGVLTAVALLLGTAALCLGFVTGDVALALAGTGLGIPALAVAVARLLPLLREHLAGLPFPTRNAVRDAAANPGRSAALATAIATLFVVTLVASNTIGGLAMRTAREYVPGSPMGSAVFDTMSVPLRQAAAQAGVVLNASPVPFVQAGLDAPGTTRNGKDLVPVTAANPVLSCVNGSGRGGQEPDVDRCSRAYGGRTPFPIVGIADASLVEAISGVQLTAGERAALTGGQALALDRDLIRADGTVGVRILGFTTTTGDAGTTEPPGGEVRLPAVAVGHVRPYANLPEVVVTSRTARRYGLRPAPRQGILFAGQQVPTEQQEDQARALLDTGDGKSSLVVERGPQGERLLMRILLVVAGALVVATLGIVAMAVALSTSQLRQDFATLAAIGTPPRIRRAIAGAQAAMMSCLGIGMGLVAGGFGAVAVSRALALPIWYTGWWILLLTATLTIVSGAVVGALTAPARLPISRRYG